MTDSNVWDNPALASHEYVKFVNEGDKIVGTILDISVQTFDSQNGPKVCPQLIIQEDGADEPRTLTAGQVQLKAKLAELRPNVGDRIAVALTKIEPRGGGKTLKHFTVETAAGTAPAAAPAAAPPASASGVSASSLLG